MTSVCVGNVFGNLLNEIRQKQNAALQEFRRLRIIEESLFTP